MIPIHSKGGILIQTRYRNWIQSEAGSILVITINTEERSLLVSHPQWEEIKKIESTQLPSGKPANSTAIDWDVTEVKLDRHGRILVLLLL